MPKNKRFFIISLGGVLVVPFLFSTLSLAKPVPLSTVLGDLDPPKKTRKKAQVPAPKFPEEYRLLERAREAFEKRSDIAVIESIQKEIRLAPLTTQNRAVDKEFDDLVYALEIKKGMLFEKKKSREKALQAFQKGLSGLGTFKWIFYWREGASKALAHVCTWNKKTKDEACLALARKVSDAFPKAANETKDLRALPLPDSVTPPDFSGERLSQNYTEKTEKDEEAFQELLDHYLKNHETEFVSGAKEFLADFPKSSIRFRVMFLLGEALNQASTRKEAEGYYRSIIDQTPLSYYSIVSAERLGLDLKTKIKTESLMVDLEPQVLTPIETASLERATILLKLKKYEELGLELDSFSKLKTYSNDFILYLMKIASEGKQHLVAFRLANELIQRKFTRMASQEMLDLLFPDAFLKEISGLSTANGQDPLLIASLIKQESGFRDSATSSSGALGLMQLMPFTAIDVQKDLQLYQLRDPNVNMTVGVKYFQGLMTMYDGNPAFSLAAYNAGPHRVLKWRREAGPRWGMLDWIEAIPFKETRDYVTSILRNRFWYQVKKGSPISKITDLKGLTVLPAVDKN
jgi:soluble lytic murein transglycosylase-like protein